jgi:hypothetical protein
LVVLSELFNIGPGEKERTNDDRSNLVGAVSFTAAREIHE